MNEFWLKFKIFGRGPQFLIHFLRFFNKFVDIKMIDIKLAKEWKNKKVNEFLTLQKPKKKGFFYNYHFDILYLYTQIFETRTK